MPYSDPEEQKAHDRAKYLRNRDKVIARSRKRSITHKKEIAKYHDEYRRKNQEHINTYHRKWRRTMQSQESKERERENTTEWRHRNTLRLRERNRKDRVKHKAHYVARMATAAAIACGLLIRPDRCAKCGKTCKPQAHHSDYSKMIEVVWLCHPCHLKAHNGSFNPPIKRLPEPRPGGK